MVNYSSSVLLAGQNPLLAEGIRGLLQPVFAAVVMVADLDSLVASAGRLKPSLAIVDLALGRGDIGGLIERLRTVCPALKVLVLSPHDELSVAASALRAGADGFVVTRTVATELLPAVSKIMLPVYDLEVQP